MAYSAYFDPDDFILGFEKVPCRFADVESATQINASGVLSQERLRQSLLSPYDDLTTSMTKKQNGERNMEVDGEEGSSKKTDINLEYYLATALQNMGLLKIELPKAYRKRTQLAIDADPTSVDLHALSPNYYRFAANLVRPCGDVSLAQTLKRAFLMRADKIFMKSTLTQIEVREREIFDNMEAERFYDLLENEERELFDSCRNSAEAILRWNEQEAMDW